MPILWVIVILLLFVLLPWLLDGMGMLPGILLLIVVLIVWLFLRRRNQR